MLIPNYFIVKIESDLFEIRNENVFRQFIKWRRECGITGPRVDIIFTHFYCIVVFLVTA